ncbi:pilus assembly PilX family protein [Pseudomonas turukhanskensis]|uniref:Type 4 fimbrial biogenesis protein PilX N-terminal domain-containing protein n=1 Tax=Pseudomonas turukhanskensis TaxID=1806536 RepID=A0A9W6KAK8_9PSED|nr:PilX N-terminal domain-containing pilus assembly protein [Pseudomonas turukhanskensis]GLK90725.1 hypothetical protein GCM10017655_37890 [Pseudomonas turukhanskensis]
MTPIHSSFSSRKQNGAVLIVALVMLLLLTIIGISSMRGTTMQERMAGNMRDQSQAFQASETSLRRGELAVRNLSVSEIQNLTTAPSWQNSDAVTGLPTAPKYKLTPIPGVTIKKAGESIGAGSAVEMAVVRVEAEGYGASENDDGTPGSTVSVRSIYVRR